VTTLSAAGAVSGSIDRSLQRHGRDWKGDAFMVALLGALLTALAFLVVLLGTIMSDGLGVYTDRGASFLTSGLSRSVDKAGIWQGIRGSLIITAIVAVVAFPLGIATAVYLEEYATDSRFTRFVSLNIRNLAGVPSVVYGLLGFSLFVKFLGDDLTDGGGLTGGRSVISAGLTMAVLVLPLVIITTTEALRAVPHTLREGAIGIGATRWDTVRTMVLPNATPGILTGIVLTISRAIGETAPLLLIGGVTGFLSSGNQSIFEQLRGGFTALPLIVYRWSKEPKADFREALAPAAIIALLVVTLACNAIAIILRNRFERRQHRL
jgi:phosphate transport system permease protein